MSSLRGYSPGTRAALQTLSRGTCYYPGCGEPVVRLVEDEYIVNYEIAHIYAAREKGARHEETMSDKERKDFSNLILLCLVHHKRVDRTHRHKYPPEMLLKWKAEREADGQDALAGLTRLTEDDLNNILTEAFEMRNAQIMQVLERLEESDSKAADVMATLLDELDQMRRDGPFLNPDSVETLSGAARSLASQNISQYAEVLWGAASILGEQNVTNDAEALAGAARQLASLSGMVDQLSASVARLEGMQGREW
ncbi:MAG: hypothetical protein LC775_20035 [Acidobacteria bacterium]|nr:hypothetical protein [Acidobacteriota bacterium]